MNEIFLGVILFVVLAFMFLLIYRIQTQLLDTTHSALQDIYTQESSSIVNLLKTTWQVMPFVFLILILIYVIYLLSKREQYEYGA